MMNNVTPARDLAWRLFPEVIKRQRRTCPGGYIPCGDETWCHLPGTICCPQGSVSCPTATPVCCSGGRCARQGHQCCPGNSLYTCPVGASCCPSGGCARSGETCCGETVCFASEKCCSGTHCVPKSATCCGEGYCEVGSTCCNGVACAKMGFVCCPGGQKFACRMGEACCVDENDGTSMFCGRGGKCLPTLRFPNVRGVTDEVADNICKGLKAYYKKHGHVDFTWNGPGRANRRITRRNRRASGCGGGLVCPAGYNCDEFPLASTAEGGAGASIGCVPEWLNGFYGYWWNIWRIAQLRSGFTKGSQFRITISECDFNSVLKKKDDDGGDGDNDDRKLLDERAGNDIILSSHGDVTLFDGSFIGNGTQGNNVVFVPLTQDAGNPGRYTLNYALKEGESITSGWIMDQDGEIYETLDELKPGESNTTTFDLEDADDSPVYFFGWTKSRDVQIEVSLEAPPPAATSSAGTSTGPDTEPTSSKIISIPGPGAVPTTSPPRNNVAVRLSGWGGPGACGSYLRLMLVVGLTVVLLTM